MAEAEVEEEAAQEAAEAEEVAEAVIWHCSDRASFVSGHTMAVDGAYVVQ